MKQGTIYRSGENAENYPYFIIVQTDLMRDFNTRVVIPLARKSPRVQPVSKVNPVVWIEDDEYILMAHLIQTVLTDELDDRAMVEVRPELRDVIVDAVDFVTTGS